MVIDPLTQLPEASARLEASANESSLKYSTVSLSDVIARGKRLEASVFDVEAKQARERIARGRYGSILLYGNEGLIKSACYPGRFKRIYCMAQNGVDFYLPSQMTDVYPKPEKYISRLTKCDIEQLRLKPQTLLLTRSGTIGTVSYVSKTIANRVFSDDVIRITFKQEYDLGYVYAFLKSKTGNLILQTNGYGSVITHLEPEHLEEMRIPNAPVSIRARIHTLMERSYALRDASNALIDEATALLIDALALPPIQAFSAFDTPVNAFDVKLSDMDMRLDATYHVPAVIAITSHLRKHAAEIVDIGDRRISKALRLPGRFKRVYVDKGYGVVFFSGKNIGELDPSDKRYLSFSQHDKKIQGELLIQENMILVTCSGTVGHVALVPKHWNGWAMTHDIIRLVPQDGMKGYVYIWLGTEYARKLLQAKAYGSVVTHIELEHFAKIPVPILQNPDVQKRIDDLALEANAKRYEAYRLEQEALRIMDDEVIFAKPT